MSITTAREMSNEMIRSTAQFIENHGEFSDESEDDDDPASDFEAFQEEVNNIEAEYQLVDEDDELDQYVDQIENETQKRGTVGSEQPIQAHLGGANRLPCEQPEANVASEQKQDVQQLNSRTEGMELNPRTTVDHFALAKQAELRADEEQKRRVQLETKFLEEKTRLEQRIEQLQCAYQVLDDHSKQLQMELGTTQGKLNITEQEVRIQAEEIQILVAEKSCLSTKLQTMQQNELSVSNAKQLSNDNKRLSDNLKEMTQRAVEAEVGIYVLKQRFETDGLKRSLNDVQLTIDTIRKIVSDISALARTDAEKDDVRAFLYAEGQWMNIREEMANVLRDITAEYERYIATIRGGTKLTDLVPIRIPDRPQAPATPKMPAWVADRQSELLQRAVQPPVVPFRPISVSPPPGLGALCMPSRPQSADIPKTPAVVVQTDQLAPVAEASSTSHQQPEAPPKPRTQALFDGVAALVPNTTRKEIADAIGKAREALPNGFRELGLTGAIQRVADTVCELRRQQEPVEASAYVPPPLRRTVTQPQQVRIMNGGAMASVAEIASATVASRKEVTPVPTVETAAEKVSFFDAPKDDDCSICHEPFRSQVDLERCRVCHTVFHHSCLKTWLGLKKTCPICNRHMLLDEEFPAL